MRRALIVAVAVAVAAALLVLLLVGYEIWYRTTYPVYSFRYRLTVEVEADGGIRTGTGIFGVTWKKQIRLLPDIPLYSLRTYGQAVVVDLGKRGLLLVPMGQKVGEIPFLAFKTTSPAWRRVPRTPEEMSEFLRKRGTVKLSEQFLPQFIWLREPSDPDSGRYVLPTELSTVIGPDVHLHLATAEISDLTLGAAISTGIEKRLPWLVEMKKYQEKHGVMSKPGEFNWNAYAIWDVD